MAVVGLLNSPLYLFNGTDLWADYGKCCGLIHFLFPLWRFNVITVFVFSHRWLRATRGLFRDRAPCCYTGADGPTRTRDADWCLYLVPHAPPKLISFGLDRVIYCWNMQREAFILSEPGELMKYVWFLLVHTHYSHIMSVRKKKKKNTTRTDVVGLYLSQGNVTYYTYF